MKLHAFATVIALALAATAASAQDFKDRTIALGGGQQGSQNFSTNAGIARILSNEGGLNARVHSYGGAGAYLPLINRGELDMAAVTSPEVIEAMTGTLNYEGKKQENIRLAARLLPTLVGLFVKKDSPVKKIADLKGLRIVWGIQSQPTLVFQLQSMLANGGLTADDMQKVPAPSVVRGLDDFVGGRADVGFFALAGGRLLEADTQLGGVRFLPMNPAPEAVMAIRRFTPGSYLIEVKPRPGQVGIHEPTWIMSYDYVFVVGMHVPGALIAKVLRTLSDHEKALNETAPALRDFRAAEMSKSVQGLAYHPAAIGYYTETGHWPAKTN